MEIITPVALADLLARLNGYADRGQIEGLAFVATTKDGNYVTGYGGTYGQSPIKGVGPAALLHLQLMKDAADRPSPDRNNTPDKE